jgi:AcrR family transcriptional regulator
MAGEPQSDGAADRRGRPRSLRAWNAVLTHAEQILEQEGYRALTVEAVARRSGVSKTTIYRWWPDRAAVAMDAILTAFEGGIVQPDTGSVMGDLGMQLASVVDVLTSTPRGQALAGLIAEAQTSPDVSDALRARFVARRRAAVIEVIERGRGRGELSPDTDPEIVADLLYGPIYYRLMIGHARLDRAFATAVLNQLRDGLAPASAASPVRTRITTRASGAEEEERRA